MRGLSAGPATASLAVRERAMVDYALHLTRLDRPVGPADVERLRTVGLDDDAIRHLVQIIGYFNYVNRHVDGLGVQLEPDHPGRPYADLALE